MIYLTLFWEFAKVSIFCVGGGYASMPLIQSAVVALIAAAGISFVVLALWNVETLPEDLTMIDPLGGSSWRSRCWLCAGKSVW